MSLAWKGVWREEEESEFSALAHWVFLAVKLPCPVSAANLSHAHYLLQSKENIVFPQEVLKTKPQSPFPSLPAFLGSLPTVRDPCLSQGGQKSTKGFSNVHSFPGIRGQAVPERGGTVGAVARGRCWAHLPQVTKGVPSKAAGKESHSRHVESEGAECTPAHLCKTAHGGKKTCCVL